jgi:hypothetical protein
MTADVKETTAEHVERPWKKCGLLVGRERDDSPLLDEVIKCITKCPGTTECIPEIHQYVTDPEEET